MHSTGAIDDAVAGEVMHTRRAEKVMGGSRNSRRALTLEQDVVFFLDEISQAIGSKLRNQDMPYTPKAEKVDFGPPPIEVCDLVAKSVPTLR